MVWVCFYLNVPCAIVFTCILGSSKSTYKYKDTALFLEVSEPEASHQERNPASTREELFPLSKCWPFSSLACGQSLHLFLERGLFAQEGAPRSHTNSHCTDSIKQSQSLYKPQAPQENSLYYGNSPPPSRRSNKWTAISVTPKIYKVNHLSWDVHGFLTYYLSEA